MFRTGGTTSRLYNQDNREYRQNMVVPIKWVDGAKKVGLGFKRKIGPQMLKWRKWSLGTNVNRRPSDAELSWHACDSP